VTPGANGSFTEFENGATLQTYQGRTTDEPSTGGEANAGALQALATLNADAATTSEDS
jgi:hypothetical protein